ncbi:MAG: MFS transporter [Candidatus Hadarchaeales archaeon]
MSPSTVSSSEAEKEAVCSCLLTFQSRAALTLSSLLIPLLAQELNLSYFQLGLVVMSYGLAMAASNFLFGRLSDLRGKRLPFIKLGFALAFPAFLLQLLMKGFGSMLLVRTAAGFCAGVAASPLIAHLSELPHYREKVWLFSGFTSLGWTVGYIGAGLVPDYWMAFLLSSVLFLLAFLLAFRLSETEVKRTAPSPRNLLKQNYPLYTCYLLRHVGAQAVWTIFPVYLLQLGASRGWIGGLHALNCGMQFVFMSLLSTRGETLNDKKLVRIGLLLSAFVFLFYSLATSYLHILPCQFVLAMAWSTLYVGSLLYLLRKNVEKATSAGLLESTINVAGVVGPFLGGVIAELWGMRASMLIACGLSLAATALSSKL